MVLAGIAVMDGVLIGVLAMSSLSDIGRRNTYSRVACVAACEGTDVHTVRDIDPDEPSNMRYFFAFEWTQAAPQSFWLNDFAS